MSFMEEVQQGVEPEDKSRWKIFFSLFFIFIVIVLLIVYWFIPINTIDFGEVNRNYNFSINGSSEDMQFYPNMRYTSPTISYKIFDCTFQKENDMKRAFEVISSKTNLDFYPVSSDEDIFVTCDSKNKLKEGMFIAGEGGPTETVSTDMFNVILKGDILLIKESECIDPNVATHELLHALGFDHSDNRNNILYPISRCEQTVGDEIPTLINELYSYPSYPDLVLENVSALMNGKYLEASVSIRNYGLEDSQVSNLIIYADEKIVREVEIDSLVIGDGVKLSMEGVWISQIKVNAIKFVIESEFEELDKINNEVTLAIK